jgi:hypothetical protein
LLDHLPITTLGAWIENFLHPEHISRISLWPANILSGIKTIGGLGGVVELVNSPATSIQSSSLQRVHVLNTDQSMEKTLWFDDAITHLVQKNESTNT